MGLAVLPKYAVLSCMLGTLQSTLNTTLEHVDSIRDDAVLRTSKALLLLLVDFTLYLLCWIPVYSFRLRFLRHPRGFAAFQSSVLFCYTIQVTGQIRVGGRSQKLGYCCPGLEDPYF